MSEPDRPLTDAQERALIRFAEYADRSMLASMGD